MRLYIYLICLVCFIPLNVQAHHPGHGSSVSSGVRSLAGVLSGNGLTKPVSQVYASFELAQQDESLGQIYTYQLGGEYALSQRLSLGGMIPFRYIDSNFRSARGNIGDVEVSGKYLLLESRDLYFYLNSAWTFPTGNENQGLGRGAVSQSIDGFLAYNLKEWTLFAGTGLAFGYESNWDPQWQMIVGASSPKVLAKRIKFSLSLLNSLFLKSDVFQNGSGKLFVQPQIHVDIDKKGRLVATVGGRVSLFDYLSKKSGVTLTNSDNALLSDIKYAGNLGLNYYFK